MHVPPLLRRSTAGAAALTVGLSVAAIAALSAAPASAAASTIDDASLSWSLSNEANSGAYFGGCNFLSAGVAGDTGSSTPWTATNPTPGYAAKSGNVSISYPKVSGGSSTPTFGSKCQTGDGTKLTTSTNSGGTVTISDGTGSVDASAGTADISWDGAFSVAFYGGMTYWSAEDPKLHVAADGTGELTATASGYAASRDGGTWAPLTPRTIHLATLTGVKVTSTGITVSPDWKGVAPSSAKGIDKTNPDWGSWPSDFVAFQNETGQSSYWYSSGSSDAAVKKPQPITIAYTAADEPTTPVPSDEPTTPAPSDEPTTPVPSDEPTTPVPSDEPMTPAPSTEPTGTPSAPSTTPSTSPEAPAATLSTGGTTTFTVGDRVPLTATGLAANTMYEIVLHSDPVLLDTVTTDTAGAFSTSVVIPAGTPAGSHTLQVETADGEAVLALGITVTDDGAVVVDPVSTVGATVNTGGTTTGPASGPWIGLAAGGAIALIITGTIAYRRRNQH